MTATTDRLDAFLHELDRTRLEDLEVLSLPEPDPDARTALLARVDTAAREAGVHRAAEIAEARLRVRELMFARFARLGLDVTWAGISWQSPPNRARERVKLIVAVEDAAVAAIMEDRLDPDDLDALRDGFRIASSMPGAGPSGVPDLTGSRAAAAPLSALVLTSGAGGIGIVAAIAALLRRRRRKLEDED